MSQDSDFDSMMKRAGVRRLNPEGSAAPTGDAARSRTVRRRAGETKAANPTAAAAVAPAAPVVPDRSAEIAELEVLNTEIRSEAFYALRGQTKCFEEMAQQYENRAREVCEEEVQGCQSRAEL